MSTASSQQLIQKLLKAEEEAEQLIAKARENRVRKLREAVGVDGATRRPVLASQPAWRRRLTRPSSAKFYFRLKTR